MKNSKRLQRKNGFTVAARTRHAPQCNSKRYNQDTARGNECSCPKFLYINDRGKVTRPWVRDNSGATSRSWATALEQEERMRLARSGQEAAAAQPHRVTLEEAVRQYLSAKMETLTKAQSANGARTATRKLLNWASQEGVLYLDEVNRRHMQAICNDDASAFRSSRSQAWDSMKPSSKRKLIGELGAFFKHACWLYELPNPIVGVKMMPQEDGHVRASYTSEQMQSTYDALAARPALLEVRGKTGTVHTVFDAEKTDADIFYRRLYAFLRLQHETGCDPVDAVKYDRDNFTEFVGADGKLYSRYNYQRTKFNARKETGWCEIVFDNSDLFNLLRDVPVAEGATPEQPFFFGRNPYDNRVVWSRRLRAIREHAGITHVLMPIDKADRRAPRTQVPASGKLYRHTFVVDKLKAGLEPKEIAPMIGHKDGEMIKKHYSAEIEELEQARREAQVQALKRSLEAANAPSQRPRLVS